MAEAQEQQQNRVLKVLEAMKQASQDLQNKPKTKKDDPNSSSSIKALLQFETETEIFSTDPNLSTLSHYLSDLKSLLDDDGDSGRRSGLRSYFHRRVSGHEISRVAGSIGSEIQAWIDREIVENLVEILKSGTRDKEEEKLKLLIAFENRVSQGFDRELQGLVLKSKVFELLESLLCDPKAPQKIRERSGFAVAALLQFNKDVFVSQLLMGQSVRALISMSSASSIQVLCTLIRLIKSPLVDDIESNGELPKIITLLESEETLIKVLAMDCLLEIGYFGRKEAIEEMLENGLVKKLVELQRSDLGGDLVDMGRFEEDGSVEREEGKKNKKKSSKERRFLEKQPFASGVARFAIQLEVGAGLRQREKRGFKQDILRKVREAVVENAEAATIVAEVLWGSNP